MAKAGRIIAIDINEDKFEIAGQLGATDFINPAKLTDPIQNVIVDMTDGGVDYSFECVGKVDIMRPAKVSGMAKSYLNQRRLYQQLLVLQGLVRRSPQDHFNWLQAVYGEGLHSGELKDERSSLESSIIIWRAT